MLTTIHPSPLTRATGAATEIRLDRAQFANLNTFRIAGHLNDLSGELVAQDSGIAISRMAASKRMQVAAADSNFANADQRLSQRRSGTRCLFLNKLARRCKQDLAHTLFRRRRTELVQPLCNAAGHHKDRHATRQQAK